MQTHAFCQRCGEPTVPTQAGLRRSCRNKHKQYPRTDPVVRQAACEALLLQQAQVMLTCSPSGEPGCE